MSTDLILKKKYPPEVVIGKEPWTLKPFGKHVMLMMTPPSM